MMKEAISLSRRTQRMAWVIFASTLLASTISWDATLITPNAAVTPPLKVRGKWKIGFLAIGDINVGDEVVWDYNVSGEVWSGCRLSGGAVKPAKKMLNMQEEATASDEEEEVAVAVPRGHRSHRWLCYCPIEGCASRPLVKLSNHLSQVHHLSPKERTKYLGMKRKFATTKDIVDRKKRTMTLRRSQRTLLSLVRSYRDQSESETSEYPECSGYETEAPLHNSEYGQASESEQSPSGPSSSHAPSDPAPSHPCSGVIDSKYASI